MNRSRARSPNAIEFARLQRAMANEFAGIVWQWVRNRQIRNQKFRREYPIPPYTADFCCVELKLILEIDGADHLSEAGKARDRAGDEFLARQGYRVVRILGYEILRDGNHVLEMIGQQVEKRLSELDIENRKID